MTGLPARPELFRIRVLQVAYDDAESMRDRVQRVASRVRELRDADLIVLPELWAPGYFYFSEWSKRAETLDGDTVSIMADAAVDVGAVVHMGSVLERASSDGPSPRDPSSRGLWNTSVVLSRDGSAIASYRKIHPFGFGEGEPTLIDAGTRVTTAPIGPEAAPNSVIAGLATCYDLRFPELFRELVKEGSSLFIVPAAWPAARREHWQILGRARAIENQAFVVQCNTGGTHAGVVLGGHSQIISPRGEVLAQAGAGEEVLAVDIDLDELAEYRRAFPVLNDRRL